MTKNETVIVAACRLYIPTDGFGATKVKGGVRHIDFPTRWYQLFIRLEKGIAVQGENMIIDRPAT